MSFVGLSSKYVSKVREFDHLVLCNTSQHHETII